MNEYSYINSGLSIFQNILQKTKADGSALDTPSPYLIFDDRRGDGLMPQPFQNNFISIPSPRVVPENYYDQEQLDLFYNSFVLNPDEAPSLARTMSDQSMFGLGHSDSTQVETESKVKLSDDLTSNKDTEADTKCEDLSEDVKTVSHQDTTKTTNKGVHGKKIPPRAKPATRSRQVKIKEPEQTDSTSVSPKETAQKPIEVLSKKKQISKLALKRLKDREKSQRSREKKKHHFEELEDRVKFLEEENAKLKAELAAFKGKMTTEPKDIPSSKFQPNSAENLAGHLQELFNNMHLTNETKSIITNFRAEMKELTVQSKIELKNTFSNIIDNSLPGCTRSILWTCLQRKGIFQLINDFENGVKSSDSMELGKALKLTENQKKQIKQGSILIRQEAIKLKELIESLLSVRGELFHRIQNIQHASQITKLYLTSEQFKIYFNWAMKENICSTSPSVMSILNVKPEERDFEEEKEHIPNGAASSYQPKKPSIDELAMCAKIAGSTKKLKV